MKKARSFSRSGSKTEPGSTRKSDLRPISARALKSAVDTLRPYLFESRVLDLYSGKGRFASAALKEGALLAILVEKNAHSSSELRRIISRFGDKGHVIRSDVFTYLEKAPHHGFDLVFADPPFAQWTTAPEKDFHKTLFEAVYPLLKQDAIFLVKHPKSVVLSGAVSSRSPYTVWKTVVFGESALTYFLPA